MANFTRGLGIDLGTTNTVIVENGQVILHEPTAVSVLIDEWKMIEVGQAAKDMTGRVPDSIEVYYPIQNGVIAEYEITENFLKYQIRKIVGSMLLFRPSLMLTVPYGITSVERRAVHEAGLGAGGREVALIEAPLAAALGIDLPIAPPSGNMIICLGGGTNQVGVLAMNSIIAAEIERGGGNKLDLDIIDHIRKTYGVILSRFGAEIVKMRIGAAMEGIEESEMEVQGQDQVTGLPRSITLRTGDIVEAVQEELQLITKLVRRTLEKTPPELISDIMDRGVALCGGGTQLHGIERYLTKELGIPAYLVDNPTTCTAEGAARAMGMMDELKRSLPVT